MLAFNQMVSQQRKWMFFFLIILLMGLIITPYHKVFLGLFLGGIVSFLNMILLQRHARKLGKAVVENKGIPSLWSIVRILLIILLIIFALRFENLVHRGATVIGLMLSYIVMPLERFLTSVKEVKEAEKTSDHSLKDSYKKG